jgi:hypothetical protein
MSDDVILEIVVAGHVNHDRPAGLWGGRRGMRDADEETGERNASRQPR